MTITTDDLPKRGAGVKRERKKTERVAKEGATDAGEAFMDEEPVEVYVENTNQTSQVIENVTNDALLSDKVLLKMERDNMSYTSNKGVRFSKEHPFQTVDKGEADELVKLGFREAVPDEVLRFYEK